MKSTPYTGTVSAMRKSPWLASEDLLGIESVRVTIEAVIHHEDAVMDGGRIEAELYALQFAGREKQMVLNATNRRALSMAYGSKTADWHGKEVELYVASGVRKPGGKRGETTTGLRLRPVTPPTVDLWRAQS